MSVLQNISKSTLNPLQNILIIYLVHPSKKYILYKNSIFDSKNEFKQFNLF